MPTALEQDVRAFLDLLLQTVVEIVVHLLHELVVGQRAKVELLFLVRTVVVIGILHFARLRLLKVRSGRSGVASTALDPGSWRADYQQDARDLARSRHELAEMRQPGAMPRIEPGVPRPLEPGRDSC